MLGSMPEASSSEGSPLLLSSSSGLRAEVNANGSLRRFDCGALALALFVGNEVEGGPANLYLRRRSADGARDSSTALLGPRSPTRFRIDPPSGALVGTGTWLGIEYALALVLAHNATAWFWHVRLLNASSTPQQLDLTYVQDVALAPYGAVRLNEYYVSQYLDHTPVSDATRGIAMATRQNLAVDGRHPWSVIGSLRRGVEFATDALQFYGRAGRESAAPAGCVAGLPSRRLQHEHALIAIRDEALRLEPDKSVDAGFFGSYVADHPGATSQADLELARQALALPESAPCETLALPESAPGQAFALPKSAAPATIASVSAATPQAATLFSSAPLLAAEDLSTESLQKLFGAQWRHEERDESGNLLSFFHGKNRHVVLRAKERRVLRPHGHILRTGRHTTPDETSLTSTVWMSGVFHSMVTQGHVNINRLLSTVHGYVGLFRSHGQRVFAQIGGGWHLLDVPSAFEMEPDACLWVYRHAQATIEIRAEAHSDPQELTLSITVTAGGPVRFLISHHVSLNGDDGSVPGSVQWRREGAEVVLTPAPSSDLGRRFPGGSFRIAPLSGTTFETVAGDELLFVDGHSRAQPFVCVVTAPAARVALQIRGHLVPESGPPPLRMAPGVPLIPEVSLAAPCADAVARLTEIIPWLTHNALVHYLAPRGLEQYSGGGWGTRDVCQGPVEMLLALGAVEPIRDLLLRVMKEQNPDGDWPQWFTFFERERGIRAGDSHGDIVFWPLVVLGQYLIASADAGVLDESVPFFDAKGPEAGERATVWQHVQRALSLSEKRVIAGTALAAYGHGDWNDSLQPADPAMRERMCSAWTVTLHYQTLTTLAQALRCVGRAQEAPRLESLATQVHADFQRWLIADGVLAGYVSFEKGAARPDYLLHPRDERTGLHYSSLAMIHAILEDMLTPAQTREHLKLIDTHLSAPDGVRLFDQPMPYHGGVERIFQRAETATFFGREIGLMYTHAHLRFAQALAHVGEAGRFFRALCQANPVGIAAVVPTATLRQANCYYSSSDAAFADRYQASEEYSRVVQGTIALDGGWRVYSSGAGIALGLIMRRFLGLSCEATVVRVDPVIPQELDGLRVALTLLGCRVEVTYRIKGAGCGVNEVSVNGHPVTFTRASNPHRRGAALVSRTAMVERLTSGRNTLTVDIG
jgi:1,2-beta-oligoglucan phosphorylase